MKYLLVIAHPDDEVLGAGASIYKWTRAGHQVDVCIMCTGVQARAARPCDSSLRADLDSVSEFLGIGNTYGYTFPNIEMNNVPHLQLVQAIEKAILQSQPDIIITHHPSDPNNDHMQTSMACQEAIRIFQRREGLKPISEVWYMEVPSCTEWVINSALDGFHPNCYVETGEDGIEAKTKALAMYRDVMHPYPHPRSPEYIRSLATVRGSQWGLTYAEAFEVAVRRYV